MAEQIVIENGNKIKSLLTIIKDVIYVTAVIGSILFTAISLIFGFFKIPAEVEANKQAIQQSRERSISIQYNIERLMNAQGLKWEEPPEYWKDMRF